MNVKSHDIQTITYIGQNHKMREQPLPRDDNSSKPKNSDFFSHIPSDRCEISSEGHELLLKRMKEDPEFVRQLREDAAESVKLFWEREEAYRLERANRPLDLKFNNAVGYSLRDIMRGIPLPTDNNATGGPREMDFFVDMKDAPAIYRVTHSLEMYMAFLTLYQPETTAEEAAMYREGAMRMAEYIADNYLDKEAAGFFMAEMRALKEFSIYIERGAWLGISPGFRADHRMFHLSDPKRLIGNTLTTQEKERINTTAQNFDAWLQEERFSAVAEWMERLKADIAQL